MATRSDVRLGRALLAPAVVVLAAWAIVPLVVTAYFSTIDYRLLVPTPTRFVGIANYVDFVSDPAFLASLRNTVVIVVSVIAGSLGIGLPLALLLDQAVIGRRVVRLMVIAPFFIMPTVSALVWKNLLLNPVNGLMAWLFQVFGMRPIDWFADAPLAAIILVVSWQWLPVATLILLTSLQSVDREQIEAAAMDGAGPMSRFLHVTLPHLARPMSVVVLISTIFLLGVFAEIFVTTSGGPGIATTNLAYLVFSRALLQFDVGSAAAGGILAVITANVVAIALLRVVGRSLER